MKHKVSELSGALLDLAVAKAQGDRARIERVVVTMLNADDSVDRILVDEDRCVRVYDSFDGTEKGGFWLNYSGKWELGGPILEREGFDLEYHDELTLGTSEKWWEAYRRSDDGSGSQCFTGSTALIAAMRAHVASEFGAEVDLP